MVIDMSKDKLVQSVHPLDQPEIWNQGYSRKPYNLKKIDDMSLAILRLLSRFRSSHQAARSKYLWEAYLSKSFPDCTYKQMMSRLQKLGRARLVVKYYRESDLMFERAYWQITEEGLLRIELIGI